MSPHARPLAPQITPPTAADPAPHRRDLASSLLLSAALALLALSGAVMSVGLVQCLSGGDAVALAAGHPTTP